MLDRTKLDHMLEAMARTGASTLHIASECAPSMRIRDKMVRSNGRALTRHDVAALLDLILPADERGRVEAGEELDMLYEAASGARFLGIAAMADQGPTISFRRVADSPPTFAELRLPELLDSFVGFRSGLVLVTGFFGSGKSTTLAAMAARVLDAGGAHVVTVEQPVERVLEPGRGVVHQREIGRHVRTCGEGVREAVQLGADVIVAGSITDLEALDAVLAAAERGCLVLGGIQAPSVIGACELIAAMASNAAGDRLRVRFATTLRVLLSQALLTRNHGDGAVPLLEILINNGNVAKAIRSGRFEALPELMERGRGLGMQTLDQGISQLLSRNLISIDEALRHAVDRDWIYQRRHVKS